MPQVEGNTCLSINYISFHHQLLEKDNCIDQSTLLYTRILLLPRELIQNENHPTHLKF